MGECCASAYLKYFLTAHLNAAMTGLRLLMRQFLSQDLQLVHQVPLVFGDGQALCLFR